MNRRTVRRALLPDFLAPRSKADKPNEAAPRSVAALEVGERMVARGLHEPCAANDFDRSEGSVAHVNGSNGSEASVGHSTHSGRLYAGVMSFF